MIKLETDNVPPTNKLLQKFALLYTVTPLLRVTLPIVCKLLVSSLYMTALLNIALLAIRFVDILHVVWSVPVICTLLETLSDAFIWVFAFIIVLLFVVRMPFRTTLLLNVARLLTMTCPLAAKVFDRVTVPVATMGPIVLSKLYVERFPYIETSLHAVILLLNVVSEYVVRLL